MNFKIIALGIIALACVCSWVVPQQSGTFTNLLNTSTTNDISFLFAYSTNFQGKNVLTITNRAWLQFEGVAIVRVTDSEWAILTNAYPSKLVTNQIEFYK